MKKAVKVGIIILAVIAALLIGLSILAKSFLSSERLKAIVLPKAEALTGRKVGLDEISVSIFKGIVAKGLNVKERDGQKDFLQAKELVLSYRLLPLLKRQLVISKIEIVSPSIAILRDRDGRYNFSDLTKKHPQETQKSSPPPENQGLPVSVIADKLAIRDAHFVFVDEGKELPKVVVSMDAEFKGSVGREGTPRLESGHIALKEIKATMKDLEVKTSGEIEMDVQNVRANLKTVIGKDIIETSATVKNYLSVPDATVNLHAKTLDLEKLMGLGGGGKAREGNPAKKEDKSGGTEVGPREKLKASGQIVIDVATYQSYTIKDLHLKYHYAGGAFKLEPLELQFSGGDAFTAEGSLNGNLQFMGEEISDIKKNLKGEAMAKLGKGVVKKSQIFDTIVLLTGIQALKNPGFDQGLFNFNVKEEKVSLDGSITSNLFKLTPKGLVGFDKKLEIAAELKISPTLTGSLDRRLTAIKLFEDEQGWKIIPLRIKGTTEKPNVSLDEEALYRQLVPGLKRGLEKLLERETTEKSGGPSKKGKPGDILKEIFGK